MMKTWSSCGIPLGSGESWANIVVLARRAIAIVVARIAAFLIMEVSRHLSLTVCPLFMIAGSTVRHRSAAELQGCYNEVKIDTLRSNFSCGKKYDPLMCTECVLQKFE